MMKLGSVEPIIFNIGLDRISADPIRLEFCPVRGKGFVEFEMKFSYAPSGATLQILTE